MWTDEITAEVKRLRQDGFSWTHIAQSIKESYQNELKGYTESQALRKARTVARSKKDKIEQRVHSDGSIESVCLIELWDNDNITPDDILRFHHLNPDKWEIVSCTNNLWHSQDKIGRVQMYQSKVSAKPRKVEISLENIDAYFKNKVWEKPQSFPVNYDPEGETLEICLPDLHDGLLSWGKETGHDYDIHIARECFLRCISDIRERCRNRCFRKIYFVTLGDLLHTDNDNQTTTKGTFQQADGRIAKIFNNALDMLIQGLDILGSIAPVEVVYLVGNHDKDSGFMLIKALEMAFRKDSNYVFDVSPNPQKYRLVGCSLIGWTHGDMVRKNMGSWLQDRARKEYGLSKYAEIHAGHLHSESRTEFKSDYENGGVVVKHLPTISNASAWEHQQGYPFGKKALMCFVWHEDLGLRESWYSNL
jgi:hypothetical protein